MLFNSFHFLLFFPAVVCAYFALPYKYRWILLLLASWYFYMCWRMEYILLLLFSTLVDYFVGLKMSAMPDRQSRRLWLFVSLALNLGMLFLFKYFDFFSGSLRAGFEKLDISVALPELDLLLPVGISFYTFQALTYTVDIYRGELQAEKHFGRFALYIAFFPQLVAGPIERASRLLPQFREKHAPDYQRIVSGLCLIAYGFFKKIVVADRCAMYADEVFGNPDLYNGWNVAAGAFFFAIQIYGDFSGYTDIAIGSARIMGYDLMENFNRPYLARGIADFWRRWHISLSTWFRDYVYIPLGGNRRGAVRSYISAFFTFVVSGLWHGASWTFVIWGAMHGAALVLERAVRALFSGVKMKLPVLLNQAGALLLIAGTFAFVCFGWIFFRAKTLDDALLLISKFGSISAHSPATIILRDGMKQLGVMNFSITLFCIALLLLSWLLPRSMNLRRSLLFLIMTTLIIILFGRNTGNEFIYFQF